MTKFWKRSVILMVLILSVPVAVRIPIIGMIAFIPALFVISIPGFLFAPLVGSSVIDIQEFGAVPKNLFGWSLIVVFWVVASMAISALSISVQQRLSRSKSDG